MEFAGGQLFLATIVCHSKHTSEAILLKDPFHTYREGKVVEQWIKEAERNEYCPSVGMVNVVERAGHHIPSCL